MSPDFSLSLLQKILKRNSTANIKINGISMQPTLKDGDIVTIKTFPDYLPGDIVIFPYHSQRLIIHRFLFIQNNYCYCKGDNALATEIIPVDNIIGKAIFNNSSPILNWEIWKIYFSSIIGDFFQKTHCNASYVQESDLYQLYKKLILDNCSSSILFFNTYNSAEQLHTLSSLMTHMLQILQIPRTLNALLLELYKIYPKTQKNTINNIMITLLNSIINNFVSFSFIDEQNTL